MSEHELDPLPGDGAQPLAGFGANVVSLAHYDRVSGLPNRFLFREKVARMLARLSPGAPVAMLCIELDRVLRLRRRADREIANHLLCEAAARLRDCLEGGGIVARIGASRFGACVAITHVAAAQGLAERLAQELSATFAAGDEPGRLGASIGMCAGIAGAADGDGLLAGAESAVRDALAREADDASSPARRPAVAAGGLFVPASDLRRALRQGELLLEYQPAVDPGSGIVVGVEGLLRWRHPLLGVISRERVVPLAETIGESAAIARWAMEQAATQARIWQAMGLGLLPVALKVSAAQLGDAEMPDMVAGILERSGLEPRFLELELEDAPPLPQTQAAFAALGKLRAMGVRAALAGIGGSCLRDLRRLPIDVLKLDRMLVRDSAREPGSAAILRATVALGRISGLATAAEGVETREQLELLGAEGCDRAQGPYISPALDAARVAALMPQASLAPRGHRAADPGRP